MSLDRLAPVGAPGPTRPAIWGRVSGCLAWSALVLLVLVALALHVCLPLWTDAHLFDVGARVLLRSGAVYRELFYHAPPRMIFAQAVVRGLFGWRGEVLRAADFLFVASSAACWRSAFCPGRDGPTQGSGPCVCSSSSTW
jgi:hypothetical protein